MRQPPKWTEFSRYPVVSGTALLAVGVTVAWWAKVDISPLVESAMIRRGEFWRLATSMFPHIGVLHLIFNIYWLWVFGTLVEQVYGHLKTAALILLFAAGPNALEYAFATGGVGLSGVCYGLFGLLWVTSTRDERFRDAVDGKTIRLFVGWFFFCIFLTAAKIMAVGNIAHGTGAVLGLAIGLAITLPQRRALIVASTVGVLFFSLWAATLGRPKVNLSPLGGYEECTLGNNALNANRDQEAMQWLLETARYRHTPAVCWSNLGVAYQRLGNKPAALTTYRKAAEMGDSFAEYNLGMMYERGEGVPRDEQEAVKWYRKAADQGTPDALNNAAWAYATSSNPAIRNPKLALQYATQAVAATKDHPNPAFLDTLAEAQYANEQYQKAVESELQAIALASPEQKGLCQKSLAKYQLAAQGAKQLVASN
jgi:membrane associated rhomboid family serine protease